MRRMIACALAVLLMSCAPAGDEPGPGGQVIRSIASSGTFSVFVSWRPLTDPECATILAGGTVGTGWSLVRIAADPVTGSWDLAVASPVAFAQEFHTGDPYTNEPIWVRISLAAGEPGVSGTVSLEPDPDNVDHYRLSYDVYYQGELSGLSGPPVPVDFESSAGGEQPVPPPPQ